MKCQGGGVGIWVFGLSLLKKCEMQGDVKKMPDTINTCTDSFMARGKTGTTSLKHKYSNRTSAIGGYSNKGLTHTLALICSECSAARLLPW